MCMIEDSDGWAFFTESNPMARTDHKCCDCGRTIHKGETYHYAKGRVNGERHFDTFKVCRHCEAAGEWLRITCSGWLYHAIGMELEEHWDDEWELRSVQLGRLIVGHRRKWRDGADPVPDREAIRASIPEIARVA